MQHAASCADGTVKHAPTIEPVSPLAQITCPSAKLSFCGCATLHTASPTVPTCPVAAFAVIIGAIGYAVNGIVHDAPSAGPARSNESVTGHTTVVVVVVLVLVVVVEATV